MNAKTKNIIAMSVFGTLSIFARNISLSSLETAFWRGLIAITVLIAVQKLIIRQPFGTISCSQKLLLLFSGMAIGLNWVLLFMAYEHTSVAAATLAYYFAPVIVMALCPILFRERMTIFQLFCFIMATAGLFLVIGGGQNLNMGSLRGIIYGLGAACFYASVILMNKFIREGNGLERTVIQFAGAILLLFTIILFCGGFHIQENSLFSLANLFAIGMIHTGICYCLYFSSIRELKGQQTAILSYIDPFVAILVSIFVFHEPVRAIQGIGAVLILGFTCLYELKSRSSNKDYANA